MKRGLRRALRDAHAAQRWLDRGRPAEAIRFALRAVATAETAIASEDERMVPLLNNLAVCCKTAGLWDEADRSYARAIEVATAAWGSADERVIELRGFAAEVDRARERSEDAERDGDAEGEGAT